MTDLLASGRAEFAPSAIGISESQSLMDMMKRASDAGFNSGVPDKDILYVD
jgi:hypothetical protein